MDTTLAGTLRRLVENRGWRDVLSELLVIAESTGKDTIAVSLLEAHRQSTSHYRPQRMEESH